MNFYNQDKPITVEELRHYMKQLGSNYLMVGDLNAHTPVQTNKTQKKNPTGRSLEQVLIEDSICINNPINLYTYLSSSTGKLSCLDLCMSSPNLASLIEIKAATDIGSDDHRTFKISVQLAPEK